MQRLVEIIESTIEFQCEIEPSLVKELKLCKSHLFYMAVKCPPKIQEKNVTMIQAHTVLLGFRGKLL